MFVDYGEAKDLVEKLRAEKDGAYAERNALVRLLSKLFPANLGRHQPADDDWEDDWRWVVYVDLPTGQVSWHIHDSELGNFDHLTRDACVEWDGHDTAEKYRRIAEVKARPSDDAMARAMIAVHVERNRQLQKYDADHDIEEHHTGDLAWAAALLAASTIGAGFLAQDPGTPPWAFDLRVEVTDRRRQLVIAGALLVAELERLERAGG